uniref:CRK n=1 Tax=Tarenaya hassleriana TaxID=28532 RepID=T1YX80_9ROSI|nr:CRK [Tarenaya hassleriana]
MTQLAYVYNIEGDPRTFDEAMRSQDVAFWKEAINDEMDSIMINNIWILVDSPPGCKPIGCKWIFKKKMRVVFLNGDLEEEEVYMKQPEGFILSGQAHKVCKLVKSLYGLKQAPKQWHQKFDDVVLANGFRLNQSDKCVYSRFDNNGHEVIICLYVDDMIIFGTELEQVKKTKNFLSSKFSMKDLGEADVILDIRIKRDQGSITLSQSHYVEKVLKRFDVFESPPTSTPMDCSAKFAPNSGESVAQLEYAS